MPEQDVNMNSNAGAGDGSGDAKHWLDGFPALADHRDSLKQYKTVEDALKGNAEAQKLIRRTTGERIKEQPGLLAEIGLDRSQVMAAFGAPKDAKAYDGLAASLPGDLHPDIQGQISQEKINGFLDVCAKAGLFPDQAKALMQWNAEQVKADNAQYLSMLAESDKAAAAAKQEIGTLWGGDAAKNVELAVRAAQEFGGPALAEAVKGQANAELVRALYVLAEAKVAEGSLVVGDSQNMASRSDDPFDYPSMR